MVSLFIWKVITWRRNHLEISTHHRITELSRIKLERFSYTSPAFAMVSLFIWKVITWRRNHLEISTHHRITELSRIN